MNTIRDDLPKDFKNFFKRLENYLDTDLYFYGSINRDDYVHDKSDIDIAIFTDNEYSVMTKLQHYLHVKRDAFDKIVWKIEGTIVYGYKIKCDKYTDSKCEISIYNNDFKEIILKDISKGISIPLHIEILLCILKTLYYTFPILSSNTYSLYKRFIFNTIIVNKKDTSFVLLKQNKV